jgi:aminopeptidase N
MWLHESFTAYSETLFTEYHFGKEKANAYLQGTRKRIKNQIPIIGPTEVNYQAPDSDQYYKGANMLHTIRQVIDNDSTFRAMLKGLQAKFYHQTVTSLQVEQAMSELCGQDLSELLNHYLYKAAIPVLNYEQKGKQIRYRFSNTACTFAMPLKVYIDGKPQILKATNQWQSLKTSKRARFTIDENYYIDLRKN